jgi:hypothetical protein
MSTLTDSEKRYLEKLLEMQGGFVLSYSDATFARLFNRHNVQIHGPRYQTQGTSKAKKLRAFWEIEPDMLVGAVLTEMIESYGVDCDLNGRIADTVALTKSREIVSRLSGTQTTYSKPPSTDDFLHREFTIPNIQKLPIEHFAIAIVEGRLAEARTTLTAGAYLSTILLCGSVLEAVLLGAAQKQPALFNRASASPKGPSGSARAFQDWNLAQLIDVAFEVRLLKEDVKKFSHGLRDFRNYIHPYQQMASDFTPDEHTAKLCFQVLKAALASIAGERA